MIRIALIFWLLSGAAMAQDLRAMARVVPDGSWLKDGWGGTDLVLQLTQPVPFRVRTFDAPRRIVVEFQEVAFDPDIAALDASERITALRAGPARPGWSQLVLDLAEPLSVTRAWMETRSPPGAVVRLELEPTDAESFAASAEIAPEAPQPPARRVGKPLVALDPGHGGIDPGAQHSGFDEADLMLAFAQELREVLLRTGSYDVILTREDDRFVSLPGRVALARDAGADVFLSLHADALEEGRARGVTVYTLSDGAAEDSIDRLTERRARTDLVGGLDLTGTEDAVAGALIDLARSRTAPRSDRLADHMVVSLRESLGELYKRPRLAAGFSVLLAPDIPSVLLELGFMSSPSDLRNLTDPVWRAIAADGIRKALDTWVQDDASQD